MKIEERILELKKKENNSWHEPQVGVYHASQIYDIVRGNLKPKNFFKKQFFDDQTLLIFEIGNMYHSYIQSLFPKEASEKSLKIEYGDFKIIGRVDLILNEKPCELKTCSVIPKSYYPSHEYQLQCYLEALNQDYGYLTYIEKNPRTFITKNFKIPRNKELMDSIIQKVEEFHKILINLSANN